MRRITVASEPRCDAIFPDHAPAVLSITTTRGDRLAHQTPTNRGSREEPLSDDELAIKFGDSASRSLLPQSADALKAHIDEIDQADTIDPMAAILSSAGG